MANNEDALQRQLQEELNHEVMQRQETLISGRLDILEQRFPAKERSEARRRVVEDSKEEEDLKQNEFDSDPIIDGPRRGE